MPPQNWGPQGIYHWGSEENSEHKYVQRDLEDQIEEEYASQGKTYNRTNQKIMTPITTSGVLADLKNGYTRLKKDDKGYGSIEEKYGLTVDEVKELFQTESLKARKTALPKRKLEIIDDLAQPQGVDSTAPTAPGIGGEPFVTLMDNGLATFPHEATAVLPDADQKNTPAQTDPEIAKQADTLESKDSIFA